MKHTERWLTISLIVVGLTILLLGFRLLRNYSAEVSRANATTEPVSTDTASEDSDPADETEGSTEESPDRELCRALNISETVEMSEPLYCAGYKLEVTGVDVTRENRDWIMIDGLLEGLADFAENGDILSEEQYIMVHVRLTPYEEYLPYVEAGKATETYLNTLRLELLTEELEEFNLCNEPVGLSESDGTDARDTYLVSLEYGVPRELDLIFIDTPKAPKTLATEENLTAVLTFNPSGIELGSSIDVRKGVVLDVSD